MIDPQPFPDWMSDKDLQIYVEAFRAGGFRGPLNRFRAQNIDFAEMAESAGKPVTQPSYFIAGERDAVRSLVPDRFLRKPRKRLHRLSRLRDTPRHRSLGAAGSASRNERSVRGFLKGL